MAAHCKRRRRVLWRSVFQVDQNEAHALRSASTNIPVLSLRSILYGAKCPSTFPMTYPFPDSLVYLPLAESTVITFLAPMLAAWLLSLFADARFSASQKLAAGISFVGVILITRPTSFIAHLTGSPSDDAVRSPGDNSTVPPISDADSAPAPSQGDVTPAQRFTAVGFALLGVGGAACAYVTITCIGPRAHPLISVTYFSAWCTLVSAVALVAVPGVPFRMPVGPREWLLTAFLGVFGFVMQFLVGFYLSCWARRSFANCLRLARI